MKIAITGGSGFVGRALTWQLQQQQHNVVWLSANTPTFLLDSASANVVRLRALVCK